MQLDSVYFTVVAVWNFYAAAFLAAMIDINLACENMSCLHCHRL